MLWLSRNNHESSHPNIQAIRTYLSTPPPARSGRLRISIFSLRLAPFTGCGLHAGLCSIHR
jgi:hypothetical protein